MAVKVKLEKDGFKKDAYVGFSWTTLFLGIWVPSFRLDLKGFLVFLGIKIFQVVIPVFLIINSIRGGDILTNIIFYVIYLVFTYIINFLLAIFYNKIYTRAMLLDGWGPMENDDYSLAILDAYNYIEYEIDEEDKEKIAKYREYVYDVKSIERNKWLCFLIPLFFWIVLIVLLGIGLSFLVSYALKLGY